MIREHRVLALCLTGILAVAACSGSATPAPTAVPTAAGASVAPGSSATPAAAASPVTATITLGFPTALDTSHLPTYVAVDEMNKAGWHITMTGFSAPEVMTAANGSGQIEFGVGATTAALTAIQAGAKMHIIATEQHTAWDIVSTTAITKCDDLATARWGLNSPGGATTSYANYWIQGNCSAASQAAIKPLYISGSGTRAAAMVAGQLDASLETPLDFVTIDSQAPGKFHVLVDFGKDPGLAQYLTNTVSVNDAYAAAHPDVVVAFLKGLMQGYKDAQSNPALMAAAAAEHQITYTDATKAAALAEFASGVYDPTLAMNDASVNFTLQFSVKYGGLKLGLTSAQVANTTFLQQASTP